MKHAVVGSSSTFFELRPSPIHGLGLFARRDVPRHAWITYYDGERVDWATAHSRDASYMRTVAHGHEAIDGLRAPLVGRGAASFANHARPANAIFVVRFDDRHGGEHVWLKAKDAIPQGCEICVDYGSTYWKRASQ